MKATWVYRRNYLRVSTAFAKVNREVGDHLEALHAAMTRRDAMRPKYKRADSDVQRAVDRDRRRSR